jgi:hypothetical protein
LRLNDGGQEVVEVGGFDVADGDDAQVGCGGGVEGEACAGGVRMFLFLHVRSALEALLRTESGSGMDLSTTGVFRCLTVPPHKTRVGFEVAFSFSSSQVP